MMKNLFVVIASALLSVPLLAANPTANDYYNRGVAAEKAGDPVAAKSAYVSALKVNPNHAHARYRLGQLKLNSGAIAARGREAKFGAVVVPEFRMDDTTLKESLEALRVKVEKASDEQVMPNFIIQDPANKFDSSRITLSLKNVPAKVVLKYLLDQSNGNARYDEHAILITPR